MWTWPKVELTDYERQYVRYYKCTEVITDASGKRRKHAFPGVLKRIYSVELTTAPQPEAGLPAPRLVDSVQISRRARVFGLTFSGDTSSFFLSIRTASGETFTAGDVLVSAMVPGSLYNSLAAIGEPPQPIDPDDQLQSGFQLGPLLIEPNWELLPNETLDFSARLTKPLAELEDVPRRFLSIGVHVWEFPGMSYSSPAMGG